MTRLTTLYSATLLALIVLSAATPAFAQSAAIDQGIGAQTVGNAQKAAIDPATGRLRGITPEEARALIASVSRQLSQSDEGLTIVYHPNGLVSIDLEDRFQSAVLVRVEPDGTLRAQCVTTVEEAEQFLAGKLSAPVKPVALEEK